MRVTGNPEGTYEWRRENVRASVCTRHVYGHAGMCVFIWKNVRFDRREKEGERPFFFFVRQYDDVNNSFAKARLDIANYKFGDRSQTNGLSSRLRSIKSRRKTDAITFTDNFTYDCE